MSNSYLIKFNINPIKLFSVRKKKHVTPIITKRKHNSNYGLYNNLLNNSQFGITEVQRNVFFRKGNR